MREIEEKDFEETMEETRVSSMMLGGTRRAFQHRAEHCITATVADIYSLPPSDFGKSSRNDFRERPTAIIGGPDFGKSSRNDFRVTTSQEGW